MQLMVNAKASDSKSEDGNVSKGSKKGESVLCRYSLTDVESLFAQCTFDDALQ